MRNYFLLVITMSLIANQSIGQGCVAIRSTGGFCTMDHSDTSVQASKWLFNANNRYLNSFRHFIGTVEQTQRADLGTEVINYAYTLDLAITKNINKRLSVSFDLPIVYNTRSSLYEHGGKERHSTSSYGIGDIRFSVYDWILDPDKHKRANIQVGLGIKLPTGDYKYQDRFYTTTPGVTIIGPVDQSIQLGDGGTGFTTEINAFFNINRTINLYGNFFYLISPREQNGVSTARGGTPSATAVANGSDVMSVPDQMMYRGGANFIVNKFTFSAGLRNECLPVYDLIGGSNGFRRPGYIISGEPGITYSLKKVNLYAFVPIAITRSRTQSVPDKKSTEISGKYTQGDAAFADYTVNIGMSIKF